MNGKTLAKYYIDNKIEFFGENGHEKLLIGLKKYVEEIDDESNKVIGIDVGSCIGKYIDNINEICVEKNKQILLFEPNPVNIATLEKQITNKEYIKLLKHCVSNETIKTSFFNFQGKKINEIGNGVACLRGNGAKICDIDVKKLDDVLENEFPDGNIIIKFMKIDTEGNDTNVIKGCEKYLEKTKYIIFECSDCLDDFRGPGTKTPMKDIVCFLSNKGFDTYRIGDKKLIKVNDEYWNDIYENVKFWSNCFALKKNDDIIHKLIDDKFNYRY